jgi:hypothetical protein
MRIVASTLLGRLDLDDDRLAPDIAALGKMPQPPERYDEFTSGRWVNPPLMNSSGYGSDDLFVAGTTAVPTELLGQVPYIAEFISRNFTKERLFMVRAGMSQTGSFCPIVTIWSWMNRRPSSTGSSSSSKAAPTPSTRTKTSSSR